MPRQPLKPRSDHLVHKSTGGGFFNNPQPVAPVDDSNTPLTMNTVANPPFSIRAKKNARIAPVDLSRN